jgi:multidrug transporter EmrE-like cation transporter
MSTLNIILLSLSEIIGDFGFKNFARTSDKNAFIQGSLGYIGIVYFLIKCLQQGNILWVNALWDGSSAILESILAYILLGERFNHWTQYIGLGFIVGGIFLIKRGGITE